MKNNSPKKIKNKQEKINQKMDNQFKSKQEEKSDIKKLFENNELENLSDEDLVYLAKEGNNDAMKILLNRYSKFLFYKVIPFYIPGSEREDIIQEAYIGFLRAIQDFDRNKGNFFSFANICVQRHITTAIKFSNRNKSKVLRNPISLEASYAGDNDGERNLYEVITPNKVISGSFQESSEDYLIDFMEKSRISKVLLSNLTEKEREVLKLRAMGITYKEIAKKLKIKTKAVDNIIQRIRKKIKNFVENLNI